MSTQTQQAFNGYALIIGVGNYPHPDLLPLPVTINDADALYRILTDPQRAGYAKENVCLLTNEAASKDNILQKLAWLHHSVKGKPDATVLIYYSGHGGLINNEYYLLPYEFAPGGDTGISKATFTAAVNAIEAGKLMVFLDCCHAGGFTAKSAANFVFVSAQQELYEALQLGRGRAVAASSKAKQLSRILNGAKYSAFTTALIDALDYHGDKGNGYAGIFDTLTYISNRVEHDTDGQQIPVVSVDESENFLICKVDKAFATKSPFLGAAAERPGQTAGGNMQNDVQAFRKTLLRMLEERGIEAAFEVLGMISDSKYKYNESTLNNLRIQAGNPGTQFFPDPFIAQLKAFIGTLH